MPVQRFQLTLQRVDAIFAAAARELQAQRDKVQARRDITEQEPQGNA